MIAFTDETPNLERVTVTAKPVCPACRSPHQLPPIWLGLGEVGCHKCRQKVVLIALPRNATGNTLRGLFGDAGAACIVRLAVPAFRDCEIPDALWGVPLTGADAPAYVAIAVSPRQLHLYRHAPVERIARALQLV